MPSEINENVRNLLTVLFERVGMRWHACQNVIDDFLFVSFKVSEAGLALASGQESGQPARGDGPIQGAERSL